MAAAVVKMATSEGVSEGMDAADAGVSAVAAVREALRQAPALRCWPLHEL